jgi:hypothetical protein
MRLDTERIIILSFCSQNFAESGHERDQIDIFAPVANEVKLKAGIIDFSAFALEDACADSYSPECKTMWELNRRMTVVKQLCPECGAEVRCVLGLTDSESAMSALSGGLVGAVIKPPSCLKQLLPLKGVELTALNLLKCSEAKGLGVLGNSDFHWRFLTKQFLPLFKTSPEKEEFLTPVFSNKELISALHNKIALPSLRLLHEMVPAPCCDKWAEHSPSWDYCCMTLCLEDCGSPRV